MSEIKEIEFFVMVDQTGDFVLDADKDNLMNRYRDEISEAGPEASRVLHIKLSLPIPEIVAEVIEATIGKEKPGGGSAEFRIS